MGLLSWQPLRVWGRTVLFPGFPMPNSRSRARRRWISKKYSLRRLWPVYLIMLLFCITSLAIVVLVLNDIDAPRGAQAQQRTPVPAAIR
jgi:hypothetical protein